MKSVSPAVVQSDSKWLNYTTRAVVILVALGAAVLSFDALTALAVASGIRVEFGWIWAVVTDGFIFVATLAAFAFRERTGAAKYYTWSVLGTFVFLSILGNAWHAAIVEDTYILPLWVKVGVTAVPPLALFLAIHLLVLMVSPTPEQKLEYKRQKEHADRLNKVREKELEKIERQAIIDEVREKSKLLHTKPSSTKTTVNEKTEAAPQTVKQTNDETSVNVENPKVEMTVEESSETDIKTEAEVKAILDKMVSDGVALPSGRIVSEWLGKSERTGQNFMKAYKETLEV